MDSAKTAVLSGLLFGAGLAVSQMTNPARVTGFLDVAGEWDPSLAFVIGGALLVSAIAHRVDRRRNRRAEPLTVAVELGGVDGRLVLGAALFGAGWGLAGLCPGPALAALVTGSVDIGLFVLSMIAGMAVFRLGSSTKRSQTASSPELAV